MASGPAGCCPKTPILLPLGFSIGLLNKAAAFLVFISERKTGWGGKKREREKERETVPKIEATVLF